MGGYSFMAKIIDMTKHLKKTPTPYSVTTLKQPSESVITSSETPHTVIEGAQNVIQLHEVKNKFQPVILKERRLVERTILNELVSGCLVIPEKGLLKVALFDISEVGMSFEMDPTLGAFKVGEEVALRVYLNHKTYFPLIVTVKHATFDNQEGVVRHGVEYLRNSFQDVALQHFVSFIISLNEGLKIDDGDLLTGPSIS